MVPHVPKADAIDETAIQKKTIHPRPGRRTGLENGDMLKGYFFWDIKGIHYINNGPNCP
jgi:hypothetical protein